MEWTFEKARAEWKPMTRAVQHVGVPGHQFQTGVLWDGSLLVGDLHPEFRKAMSKETGHHADHRLHLAVAYGKRMTFADRQGLGSDRVRRWLEGGRLPIPHVETTDGDLLWTETVFAWLAGRDPNDWGDPRPNDLLVTSARFRVKNKGESPTVGQLWLHFEQNTSVEFGYKCRVKPELAQAISHHYDAPFGVVNGLVRYMLRGRATGIGLHGRVNLVDGATGLAENVVEWSVPLGPGEEAELELMLPYFPVDLETAQRLMETDTNQLLPRVIRFWNELLNGDGQINTPEPFVNDYLAAVAGQMSQQVAWRSRTGVWMYKTSPNWYEGYWPCNAAKALPALDLRGLSSLTRPVLQSFVDCQTDDIGGLTRTEMGHGSDIGGEGYERRHGFLGNFGDWTANPLLLSHGLELWALASHYRITRDGEWLGQGPGSPLQAMLDGFDWVFHQRQRTMHEENGGKVAHWGLLPAASAHDWLAGNTIFNDAFCIYGMAEVVRLLTEIGHPRNEEAAAELADYRKCLHDRYREARDRAVPLPLPDGSLLPFVPRIVQELDWEKPDWTITGYGPLRAGAWGSLDPNDELVDQSLAFMEAGMPAGRGYYLHAHEKNPDTADSNWSHVEDPSSDRHFLWRHYVEYETMWPIGGRLFLERDDLPRFFEWLFNNLAVVLHHDWRVGVESLDGVPSCAPGDGERWQTIRSMFINERGGWDGSQQSLWIMQAIPREWLKPGSSMSVRDMGTWFGGKIGLQIDVAAGGESVAVELNADGIAVEPREARIRLRSGDGRPLVSATINGREAEVLDGDTVCLPLPLKGRLSIIGRHS